MKLRVYLFLLTGLISVSGISQSTNFRIHLGGTSYRFAENNDPNNFQLSSGFGLFVGISKKIEISDKIDFNPQVLFERRAREESFFGLQFSVPNDGISISFSGDVPLDVTEYLLSLPIVFNYDLSGSFNLSVGPQAGILLSKKFEKNENSLKSFGDTEFNDSLELTNDFDNEIFEAGLRFGVKYDISNRLSVYVDYLLGIVKRDEVRASNIYFGTSFKI